MGAVRANPPEYGDVRHYESWCAGGGGFDQRQAETFGEAWEDNSMGVSVERAEFLIRHVSRVDGLAGPSDLLRAEHRSSPADHDKGKLLP